jgi:hypothetical protein
MADLPGAALVARSCRHARCCRAASRCRQAASLSGVRARPLTCARRHSPRSAAPGRCRRPWQYRGCFPGIEVTHAGRKIVALDIGDDDRPDPGALADIRNGLARLLARLRERVADAHRPSPQSPPSCFKQRRATTWGGVSAVRLPGPAPVRVGAKVPAARSIDRWRQGLLDLGSLAGLASMHQAVGEGVLPCRPGGRGELEQHCSGDDAVVVVTEQLL